MQASLAPNYGKASMMERMQRINIMVVVSSNKAASLLERLFRQLGFTQIQTANDAAEAVQMLKRVRVHLMVADSELKLHASQPEVEEHDLESTAAAQLHGINFVRRLRNAPQSPAAFLPVLMLMDFARQQEVIMARDAGVNEIILKPMEAQDFCARVIEIIDHERPHITAPTYRGPCRRRTKNVKKVETERRVREARVIRLNEQG